MKIKITLAIAAVISLLSCPVYSSNPVFISEVFYDSPLNESHELSQSKGMAHHNGEFIELFNPTLNDIDLKGWKIYDSNTSFYLPDNAHIAARSTILIAYQYPNSGFALSSLFPSISGIPEAGKIYYQSSIELSNNGEEIWLVDPNGRTVDQMSYKYPTVKGVKANYWNISATNFKWKVPTESNYLSLQRTEFQYAGNAFVPSAAYYKPLCASPLTTPSNVDFAVINDNPPIEEPTVTSVPVRSSSVAEIPGQFNVSPTGAATYQIPIDVPVGINGMQPSLSLVYNSQGGNGIAGWGWNISGISMISRVPKNYYYDEEKTGIIWDYTSPLALDGQRLIEIKRWNTDSVEYDTEVKSGNRIVGYNIKNWGAEFFKIYTKSGSIMQYGSVQNPSSYYPLTDTPDNLRNFRNLGWAITNIEDNNKNTIVFQYLNDLIQADRGSCYLNNRIEKILYGGNLIKNKENDIRIEFEYNNIDPSSITQAYIDGYETTTNKIFKQIKVYDNNNLQKTYVPQYETVNHKYHLINVNLININDKISTPNFDWSDNLYQYNFQGSFFLNHNFSPKIKQFIQSGYNKSFSYLGNVWGDIDGDGDQDVLMKYKLENSSSVFKYVWAIYKNNGGNFDFIFDQEYNNNYNEKNSFTFLDKDNDGKEELYCGGPAINEGRSGVASIKYDFACFKYNGSNMYKTTPEYDFEMPLNDYKTNSISIIPADFLGKGEPQFMGFITDENGVFKPMDFSESSVYVENTIESHDKSDIYISDFNGNGKSELVYVHDDLKIYEFKKDYFLYDRGGYKYFNRLALVYTYPDVNYFDKVYTGDFNGDGNTDFLIQDYPSSTWKFLISTGSTLIEKDYKAGLTKYSDIKILDVNKDGKSDILIIEPIWVNNVSSQSKIVLQISTGNGFEQKLLELYTGLKMGFATTGRVNSDKYEDIIMCSQNQFEIFNISNNLQFNKITSIKDQLNNSTTIEYDIYNSNKVKSFQNGIDGDKIDDPKKNVSSINNGSWDVVTSQQYYDAYNNLIESTSYKYGEAIIHKVGKGLLGFISDTVNNNTTSIQKINKKLYNPSFVLLLPDSEIIKKTNANGNISENGSKYSVDANPIAPKACILKQTELYSKDYLTSLESKTEYIEFDNWLNPTNIKIIKGGLVDTQTFNYIQKGAWCPNKPEYINSTQTYNGESIIQKKEFKYDLKGNLTSETVNPDDDKFKTVTEYMQYDNFGHPEILKITARDKNKIEHTRTSSVKFKLNGRFVDYKINLLGEKTTYTYDETMGLLKSETVTDEANKWSKTTSYSYDNWGKITGTCYPDNNCESNVLQWADGTGPYGSVYFKYSQVSGKAPIKVWYDVLGREIQKDTYGLNNKKISVSTEYYTMGNDIGKLYRVSEPYFEGENKKWASTYENYDEYGRVVKVTTPKGEITTDYSVAMVTKVKSPEGSQSSKINSSGFTDWTEVNGKKVNFDYYPNGLTKTSTPDGGAVISMVYNPQGKRTMLFDPDAGIIETVYNGFGELEEEKQLIHKDDPNKIVTTNNYDYSTGLLTSINRNNEITTYTYDLARGYKGLIKTISFDDNKHMQEFTYDDMNRVTNVKEVLKDGGNYKTLNRGTTYNAYGQIETETYPTGYYTINHYDTYGNMDQITDCSGRTLWKAVTENAYGQITEAQKGGKTIYYGFNSLGLPNKIESLGVINMRYTFKEDGNLWAKEDYITEQEENYKYDELNRLTNWDVYIKNDLIKQNSIVYNATSGTIKTKSDLGNFELNYGENNGKPHALTSISGAPAVFPQPTTAYPLAGLNVTYTDFKKIKTLSEMGKSYELTYGVDDQRRKSVYSENGVTKLTHYYMDDYEEEVDAVGNVRQIHYLSGAILIRETNKPDKLYYSYSDYQGSLIALTDESGNVVERYAYDPWGARRNPNNWTLSDSRTSWIINRGYTGHEHLDQFGIINMNGRVYDPLTAMFFSPDPQLQAPDNWLNYNRYGYCYGNPFKYTDPSGEYVHLIIGFIVGGVINWVAHGCEFNQQGLLAFGIGGVGGLLAAATGGASLIGTSGAAFALGGGGFIAAAGFAGASYSVGTMFTSMGNTLAFGDPLPTGSELMQGLAISMVTAGLMQGLNASMNGRDFLTGKVISPSAKLTMPPTGITPKTADPDEMVAASKSQQVKMSDMPSNAAAQSDALPMQGKVMNIERGIDGKVTYKFESSNSVSGSYKLEFESGKQYMGKGLEPRMIQSINRIEQGGDILTRATFYPAESTRAAFINEYQLMKNSGQLPFRFDSESKLYNIIWSPGKKY